MTVEDCQIWNKIVVLEYGGSPKYSVCTDVVYLLIHARKRDLDAFEVKHASLDGFSQGLRSLEMHHAVWTYVGRIFSTAGVRRML